MRIYHLLIPYVFIISPWWTLYMWKEDHDTWNERFIISSYLIWSSKVIFYLLWQDIDCMPLNLLENMPEAMRRERMQFDHRHIQVSKVNGSIVSAPMEHMMNVDPHLSIPPRSLSTANDIKVIYWIIWAFKKNKHCTVVITSLQGYAGFKES